MVRALLVLGLWLALAAGAWACCVEPVDKFAKLCDQPCHAARGDCPGCSRCDTHCMVTTRAAGNRCPTCNQFDVDNQCYNASCPEYSRSKWGAKPRPTPSPSTSPPPGPPSPGPPGPEFTPDPATEALVGDIEERVRPICQALALDPGDCADAPAIQDLIDSLPPGARPMLENVTRGPDPAGPAPAATPGPGVDAFIAASARDYNGTYLLALDPNGQPYAGIPVTATLEGEPPQAGVTDDRGWFRATWPAAMLGRAVSVDAGGPAATQVRDIRKLTWVVLKVPRK